MGIPLKRRDPSISLRCKLGKRFSRFEVPRHWMAELGLPITLLKSSEADLRFPELTLTQHKVLDSIVYNTLSESDYLLPETLTEDATKLFSELPKIS